MFEIFMKQARRTIPAGCMGFEETAPASAQFHGWARDTIPLTGWHDSSWDIRHGLEVIEHCAPERVSAEQFLAWLSQYAS